MMDALDTRAGKRHAMLLAVLLVFSGNATAGMLADLWRLAQSNEPTFLSAKADVRAAEAKTDLAFGELLPQVNLTATSNFNDRDYFTRNPAIARAQDHYNNHTTELKLTQPIWRLPSYIGLTQAKAVSSQAIKKLENTQQELFVKVVSSWLDFLAAQDQKKFTAQQIEAAKFRLAVSEKGFNLGSISLPELEIERNKLEQALAEDVNAESELQLKRAQLEQLVGSYAALNPVAMRKEAELADFSSEKLEEVLVKVESGNHNLQSALFAQEAASSEVSKQRAGHSPTLNLVASYGKNSQSVGGFPGQDGYDIKTGTIGLQLEIPIYSGGMQSAKVHEAIAQEDKSRQDVESARRLAILSAKQAWYGWQAAYSRKRASEQAMKSAQIQLRAAETAVSNGLKTEVVVFEAKQELATALRDFNKSRYEQIVNHVKLKSVMGALTEDDVNLLDALFENNPLGSSYSVDSP